jgi:hypothetical protein
MDQVVRDADTAMYERRRLESSLRDFRPEIHARCYALKLGQISAWQLKRNEFVHYQPIRRSAQPNSWF